MTTRTFALIGAALWTAGCGAVFSGPPGPLVQEHHSVERAAATRARVELDMSAGELEVQSGAATLFAGDFAFNLPSLKPTIDYTVRDGTGTLRVSQASASGNYENRWRVSLDDTTPMDLNVSLGAGDAELVLGRLNLSSLTIRLGAGDLKVDLRGTPSTSYSVKVQAGAGDTSIHLPSSVAVSARTSGLIGGSNVIGLEERDGRWINPKSAGSPVTIDVDVQHAIGDLRLQAD